MRNLLIKIRYDGRRYRGFQVQAKGVPTVAAAFQDAEEAVFGRRDPIKGCSRTDSGVHANRFCLSLQTESRIPADRVVPALNANLPPDIAAIGCREVPPDFHARYSAAGKRYLYKIWNDPVRNPFWEGFALHVPHALDADRLHRMAQNFLGTHDFSGFSNAGGSAANPVRTITEFAVSREEELLVFSVTGNGFLYNMVRILAGTLLDAARGGIREEELPEILASKDRSRAGITAPACGLYLDEVFYPCLTGGGLDPAPVRHP